MPLHPFDALPDDSRLWIFGTDRGLSEDETDAFLSSVDTFLEHWAAHGTPLTAAREWIEERFILVAVDERSEPPSGCSIDAFVRCLKDQERELGLSLVDGSRIWYRDGVEIRTVGRPAFRALAAEGEIDADTVVFDPVLNRVAEFRAGRFERPAGSGWHGALLPSPAPQVS